MKSNRSLNFVIFFFLLFFTLPLSAYRKETFMVAMRDSVRLATVVYQPSQGNGPWPTILIRTPYSIESTVNDLLIYMFTDGMGYVLAVQNTRGRFQSEGIDSLFFSDGWGKLRDGYDTVEWIAKQPWSNGKIGTWGASAFGITQYLLAGAAPPHLTCCLVMVAASNLYENAIFYGGEYRKSLVDGWLTYMGNESFIDFFVQHPDYEPTYDRVNLSTRYDSVNVPILHIAGWHDIFLQGQIDAFSGIEKWDGPNAKGKQKLVIGPWVHDITSTECGELTFPNSSGLDEIASLTINWFDRWLKNKKTGIEDEPPVKFYLMGDVDKPEGPGNRWIERQDWPPPVDTLSLYLREDNMLSPSPPDFFEPPDLFDYDPNNPVPTLGGRNLNIDAGSYDQRSVESRPDVLVYTTDPLVDSLTVIGRITVTVYASSDRLDTDFTAKLCDVYPDGRSMLVADGIIQARHRNSLSEEEFLTPGGIYKFTIDLWSTAIVFAPGHRIRLSVSSSNYPRFEKNPNTGEPFRQNTTTQIAHQTIYHDWAHSSALCLPVLKGTPLPEVAVEKHLTILGQNYPNPFNNETLIPLRFPDRMNFKARTHLTIFDITGRCVKQWKISVHPFERIIIKWQGIDKKGNPLPSGVYIVRLTSGQIVETKKIMLLR